MLEAQLLAKLVLAQVYWEEDYGNDVQGILQSATNMAADTEWENKIADITGEEYHETYEQLQARFLHNNYPDVTPEQLSQIGSTYHSLSWQHDAKISEPTDAQKRMVDQWDEECRNADAQWRHHVTEGIACMIDELDNAIGDKIHRRNLQIADLKKQASKPDLTQQVTKLAGNIGRAMVLVNKTLDDFDHENVDRQTPTLKRRFTDIKQALLGTPVALNSNTGKSGEWTKCSCGHIAQEHAENGHCEMHGCGCNQYDGHIIPGTEKTP